MNILLRLWKWITISKPKIKTTEDIIYEHMWHQINVDSENARQNNIDDENISKNLTIAGFPLDKFGKVD